MTGTDSRGANGEMAGAREAGEQGGVAGGGLGTHQPANPTLPTSSTPSPTTVDPVKAFSMEKFMGEDDEHWSFRMRLMFTQYKLLDLVEGKEKMPEAAELKGAWMKRSFDAKVLDVHSPTHATGIVLLARRLRGIKFVDGEPMQPVLDEMRDIFTKLQGGGVVYPELVQCVEIVIRLPESWSALAINLNSQQPQWSVDYIRARILEEDLRRRSVERSEEGAVYGVGGGMSGFKKKWKGKNKDYPKEDGGGGQGEVCFYCKKRRHRWRKCYQRPKYWTPPSSSNLHGGKRSGGVMGASGEEKDEEKGGKSEERKAGFFFFVNEGATDLAMAAKALLHPLTHWVIDSGSSWHMTPRADLLDEIQPAPISTVTSATGVKAKVMGMGCAKFMGADGELVGLKNVLWVPDLCANLISTSRLGDAGVNTETKGSECYRAYNDERLIWDLQWKGDVHKRMLQIPVLPWRKSGKAAAAASMEESVTEEEQQGVQGEELIGGSAAVKASATSGQADWETWHRRLAHMAVSTLEVMHKEKCVHGLQLQRDGAHYGSCEACMQNKFARFPFPCAEGSAKAPLEVVHMDLVGPMRTEGTGGVLYFLTMVDEWSRFTWARPLSKKSDAAAAIKEDWLPMVERQAMRLVKVLRSDQGGEFLGVEFTKFLKKNGIWHQLTCPGTPQQNGIAECANRTIGEAAKSLLGAAGMPYKFWPEAVCHVITIKNRVLTHVGDKHWVPYERWLGKKPSIDMLRVWGCMGLVMVPKEQRHKLEVAAVWAVHLGMAPDSKGWLMWDPKSKRTLVSRDVKFVEDVMYKDWQQQQQQVQIGLRLQEIERSAVEEVQLHLEDLPGSELTSDHTGGGEQQVSGPAAEEGLEDESARVDSPSQPEPAATAKVTKRSVQRGASPHGQQIATREKRVAAAPSRLKYSHLGGPKQVEEALSGPQKEEWKAAMDAEFNSLIENGTWELVELPEGRRPISSKWVFKVKSGADGALERFKSRLVAKGFQQKEKVDFGEIFAPVVQPVTLRTVLAGAAVKGWHVKQMDITTAFLNGILLEDIYMAQPDGYEDGTSRVCKLKKAIYGLKQAPRCWYEKLEEVSLSGGFKTSQADHSLFMLGEGEQLLLLLVYVDDILLFSHSMEQIERTQKLLMDNFKCKMLGDVYYYLGLQIERDVKRRWLKVHQSHYISGVMERYGVTGGRTVMTPVVQRPTEEQLEVAKRLVRYLGSTAFAGVQFSAGGQLKQIGADGVTPGTLKLSCFTDATWASEDEDQSSVGGFVCMVGGGPVSWRSKKQSEISQSSGEAEYMAMYRAIKEIVLLRKLLEDMGAEQEGPTPLFSNSEAAIGMANNPILNGLNKHMKIKWHWFPAGTQWSLRRPVYGLRQAPREWHDTLRTTHAALGFAPSTADPSLFLRTDTTLPPFYVLVYVDELVFATADTKALAHVKSELQKRHMCIDLGELTSYLGLWITRDRAQRTITLTQSHMVQQILQRFGFTYCLPHSTPLPTGHSLSAPPSDESIEPSGPYAELVGCLMYLTTCTRPYLPYPLNLQTRYVAPGNHQKVHWDAAKRVLRYLCSTSGMGLVLGGRARVVLTGHADASWVDDLATQRSSQGYTFSLGSGSVSWWSTRLSSVLSSSCEAEIYAGAMAAQELRWLTYLLTDLGELPHSPPMLYVDNKAMIALCQEHRLEHRTKHIALRYFLARELQQHGQLRLAYMASQANTADLFTKALQPCDHQPAIVTMVDPVVNAGVADTLETCLADARKRHADGEYGTIPLLIVKLDIRSQWATEHLSHPVSPRPVRNEGGVDDEVDGGVRVSDNNGTKQRGVIKVDGGVDKSQARVQQSTAAASSSRADVDGRRCSPLRSSGGLSAKTHVMAGGIAPTYGYFKFSPDRITNAPLQGRRDLITWRESIEPQLEVAGLKGFANGTVPILSVDDVGLRGEFHAAHLLTFMVISRCCSPVVQLALRSCRERMDAGHQAWHFILSTYQVRDDLYIAQLEEKMTHIRMREQESAMDYCNRVRRILAEMRMAGAEYSTASYISHIVKGLPCGYNLMKRMMMVPRTRESLDEDSITSYILQDEAMQEAEQPTELLPKDKGRGGGGRRQECWICHDPDHLSYECPDRADSDEDDTKGSRGRLTSRRPCRDVKQRKEKQTSKKTSSNKDVDNSSGKSRGDREASCSMVGVAEPTVSLAPKAGEDFQAVAAALQVNPMAVLLDSGCSHHLMGTKAVFIDMAPSDGVKHVRGFNGALQPVEGCGTVVLQGEAGKRVLIPNLLYIPGIQANLLSTGQLKESGVQLQGDGDEMLLIATTGEVLGRARYNGRVLCTDLRPCLMRSSPTEVVALRTIVSATKSTPDQLHARLAHVSVETIKSSAKHKVAIGLDITPSTGADPPCVSCVRGKLAWHTFPNKGSDAKEALAVVHIDLCGPFLVVAKDGSLFFLLLKDRHTRFVWVMLVAKKSDVLWEFQKWLVLVERQAKKSVLMLRSDRGGEFLRKEFTDFVDGKGIVHDLTCPYTPQQNGMAEREMRTAVESVRTMPLHMDVQHHWWHLALRQAVWVRNCLERSTTPPGTTP
ncbi:unnamed protein product [Closterium sp. NIES-53]